MLATIWQISYWDTNVGPNIVASVLCFGAGILWARVKVWPRFREHERKVDELHAAHTRTEGSTDSSVRVSKRLDVDQ